MQLDVSPNTDLSELEQNFGFRNTPRVLQFLAAQSEFIAPLLQTYTMLDYYFTDVTAHLSIADDPDIKGYTQLILTLTIDCEAAEAVASLNRFEIEWWSTLPRTMRKEITLELEFYA